jgi:anti-sigma regulatory factor (Ser/Thr protein kinase)
VTSRSGLTALANRWKGPGQVPGLRGTHRGPDGFEGEPDPADVRALPDDALSRVLTLPPVPRAVRASRQWVRETLNRWRLTDAAEPAESLVSELVTNAIRHAEDGASVVVLLMYAAGKVRMEVRDHDPLNLPLVKTPGPLDASGRGLVLVEALSDHWGVRVTDSGKSVWCELTASPRIPRRTASACRDEGGRRP